MSVFVGFMAVSGILAWILAAFVAVACLIAAGRKETPKP